jgi:hypothetical protein
VSIDDPTNLEWKVEEAYDQWYIWSVCMSFDRRWFRPTSYLVCRFV